MRPFTTLDGVAAPLLLDNIDTDQILPKQFLKTITREGLARGLFYDFRFTPEGARIEEFVLNRAPFDTAAILIAGANFGCGSSREHAPWALEDFGIRCIVAPSFADIFHTNCFNNGLLPIVFDAATVVALAAMAAEGGRFHVSLPDQAIVTPDGARHAFAIDPRRKQALLRGLDPIGQTLVQAPAIDAFEAAREVRQVASGLR